MKFGEIINKNELVIIVFGDRENVHALACDIAHSLSKKITVNTVSTQLNAKLCEALRIKGPTVFLYDSGSMILRIPSDNVAVITDKINQHLDHVSAT